MIALVMMVGVSGAVVAGVSDVNLVNVDIPESETAAFAEYGISLNTLLKSSSELTQAAHLQLQVIYSDSDLRGQFNGLINAAMSQYVDDETVAQMRVAGTLCRIGTPTSMDTLEEQLRETVARAASTRSSYLARPPRLPRRSFVARHPPSRCAHGNRTAHIAIRPFLIACQVASLRLEASSFAKRLETWYFTVFGDTVSSSAIRALDLP